MQHAAERRSLTTGCSRRYSAAAERGHWMDEIGTINEQIFHFSFQIFHLSLSEDTALLRVGNGT
jgi:hypothetical protein